jgi:hypothetical protein
MNKQYSYAVKNVRDKTVAVKPNAGFARGPLEVNVIFTDQASTAAALGVAQSLARDLGARIHLHFPVAVPFQLPLESPGVSVSFLQEQLRKVLADLEKDGFEPRAHLYLCRDRVQALRQALRPNSLVVIGGRKHWWPTPESRITRALQAEGQRVICVDSKAPAEIERALVAR